MKTSIYFIAMAMLALGACKGNENKEAAGTTDSVSAPVGTSGSTSATSGTTAVSDTTAHAAQYTCPMHPEVNSNQPGQCPKCGMDLQIKS